MATDADYRPRADDAEEAVLGAVLLNPEAYRACVTETGLRAEHFGVERHAWLWRVYERMAERGDPIDYLTATQDLEAVGKLAEFGGAAAVLRLVNETPSALNAEGYARLVVRAWWRRQKLTQLERAASVVHDGRLSILEVDTEIRDILSEHGIVGTEVNNARALFGNFDADMRKRAEDEGAGLDAGLFEFNAVFAGRYRLGEYTIIQGLANLGKSFWMSQLAAATASQVPVLYFTFEGVAEDVRDRMVAIQAGVPLDEIQAGTFSGDNGQRAFDAAVAFAGMPVDVVDSLTDVYEVRRQVEAAIMRHDFRRPMVFVDNLNNIADAVSGDPYANMNLISAELLRMVRQTGCGVVAGAQQINLYKPDDMGGVDRVKRALTPSIRTVEGSRKLSQHPHNLYGLYSADYIAEKVVRGDWFRDDDCPPGHMILMNCRQRNARGAVSAVVRWNADIPRFETKRPAALDRPGEDRRVYRGDR